MTDFVGVHFLAWGRGVEGLEQGPRVLQIYCDDGSTGFALSIVEIPLFLGPRDRVPVRYRIDDEPTSAAIWQEMPRHRGVGLEGDDAVTFLSSLYQAEPGRLLVEVTLRDESHGYSAFDMDGLRRVVATVSDRCEWELPETELEEAIEPFSVAELASGLVVVEGGILGEAASEGGGGAPTPPLPLVRPSVPSAAPPPSASIEESAALAEGDPVIISDDQAAQLLASDQTAITRAVRSCWNVDRGAPFIETFRVIIRARILSTGFVQDVEIVSFSGQASSAQMRSWAEAARRAVLNPNCQPLPSPSGGYRDGDVYEFIFEPRNMF